MVLSRNMAYIVNKIFAHAIYKIPYEDTMLKPKDGEKNPIIFRECMAGFNQNFHLNTIFQGHILQTAHIHPNTDAHPRKLAYVSRKKKKH